MSWSKRLLGGFRALFRKDQVERELDDELQSYLEASPSLPAHIPNAVLDRFDAPEP